MTQRFAQNIQTLFSARELIAAVPQRPADECLRAPALIRAATILYPPQPRAAIAPVNGWQVLPGLLREGGILVASDAPRGPRRVAFWGSMLYQVLWVLALIWFAYARFAGVPGGAAGGEGGTVIEVEFIDRVQPPPTGIPATAATAAPAPIPLDALPVPETTPFTPVPPTSAPPPITAQAEPPAPEITPSPPAGAAPPPESPLQVTEVAAPDIDFTLHAPELPPLPTSSTSTTPSLSVDVAEIPLLQPPQVTPSNSSLPAMPVPSMPVTALQLRDVPLLHVPTPVFSSVEFPAPPLPAPSVPRTEVEVHEIPLLQTVPALAPISPAVPLSVPSVPLAEIEVREIPLLQAPATRHAQTEISLPSPTPAMPEVEARVRPIPDRLPEPILRTPGISPELPPEIEQIAHAHNPAQIRERDIALQPAAPAPVTETAPIPGISAPSTRLNDEWGEAAHDLGSALVDADGRPRLAGAGVGGRLPPGTIVENHDNIDRMGTWLKRPPTGYQSSHFEQLWLPPENLLEDWVRRSIKTIMIPIPGTGKSLQCTIAFLMLGGGCGITDANLQDIEATARKPPDIPFKPELHEDQEALAPHRIPQPLTEPEGQPL